MVLSVGLLVGLGAAEAQAQGRGLARVERKAERKAEPKPDKRSMRQTQRLLNRLGKDQRLRKKFRRGKRGIVLGAREVVTTTSFTFYRRKASFGPGLESREFVLDAPVKLKLRYELVLDRYGLSIQVSEGEARPRQEILNRVSRAVDAQLDRNLASIEIPKLEASFGPFSMEGKTAKLVRARAGRFKFFDTDIRPVLDMKEWSHLTPKGIDAQVDAWVAAN